MPSMPVVFPNLTLRTDRCQSMLAWWKVLQGLLCGLQNGGCYKPFQVDKPKLWALNLGFNVSIT